MRLSPNALRFLKDLTSKMTVDCLDPEAEAKCQIVREIAREAETDLQISGLGEVIEGVFNKRANLR